MQCMDIVELMHQASSVPDILSALSAHAGTLCNIAAIPDWCVAPLKDVADVRERIPALLAAVSFTSQRLLDSDCERVKHALRVFVVAKRQLDSTGSPTARRSPDAVKA